MLPQAQDPAADAESGRGLLMVEALSNRYGWYRLEGGSAGKVVWAELPAPVPRRRHPLKPPHRREAISRTIGAARSLGSATRAEQ